MLNNNKKAYKINSIRCSVCTGHLAPCAFHVEYHRAPGERQDAQEVWPLVVLLEEKRHGQRPGTDIQDILVEVVQIYSLLTVYCIIK